MMEKRSLMETRKEYRRGRRYRKLRYRHPKFRPRTKRVYSDTPITRHGHKTHWIKISIGFTSDRQEGWLPPSIQSKVDHHVCVINNYRQALPPKTRLRIEIGRFDIARMKNPEIHGEMYQYGRLYDEENVKAYVFARDDYKCQVCGAKAGSKRKDGSIVKIKNHHIDMRSRGATDNPDRQCTVCDRCHTETAHKKGGILYHWMIDGKTFARGYRDATFMNILRRRMWDAFPSAEFTYGNFTKVDREALGLDKTHANDAVAIAIGHKAKNINLKDGDVPTTYYQQVRKKKRSLHEANPRKGRKFPNKEAKRNAKNTKAITIGRGKKAHVLKLFDKVKILGKIGWITSFTGSSIRVDDKNGNRISYPDKNYDQVPGSLAKVLTRNNGWLIGVMTQLGKG